MLQQVNLYQPMFRKQEKIFSAKTMMYVFFAAIGLFTLVYGYAHWNVNALESELVRLQDQQSKEMVRLEDLARRYPATQKSKKTENELAQLKSERSAKEFLIKTLSGRSIGNSKGFSEYLEGIARRRPAGMWLRRLELERGGEVIGIHGSSLRPELVPQFLQQLSKESSFSGSNFRIFEMQRDDKNRAMLNFTLRSVVSSGDKR